MFVRPQKGIDARFRAACAEGLDLQYKLVFLKSVAAAADFEFAVIAYIFRLAFQHVVLHRYRVDCQVAASCHSVLDITEIAHLPSIADRYSCM